MRREDLEHVLRAAGFKSVAGPDKGADWVRALLRHRLIDANRLRERVRALDAKEHSIERLVAWTERRIAEAAAT